MDPRKDYYAVLGINANASEADIKSAFRKKALVHHPDKGGDAEKFKEVNEAFSVLNDRSLKAKYDYARQPVPLGGFGNALRGLQGMAAAAPDYWNATNTTTRTTRTGNW